MLPYLHCDTDVLAGRWDDDALVWRLETSRGPLTAEVLANGCGGLVEPHLPQVPGIEDFAGPSFHSARWDSSVELTGTRVAVVGTGASAAQFVPELQQTAARVVVFQRADRAYTAREQRLFRWLPALQRLSRAGRYWSREARLRALIGSDRLPALFDAHRHGVERRRLPVLVPRRARAQRHAVADAHLHLPPADAPVRHRRLRAAHRPPRGGRRGTMTA